MDYWYDCWNGCWLVGLGHWGNRIYQVKDEMGKVGRSGKV